MNNLKQTYIDLLEKEKQIKKDLAKVKQEILSNNHNLIAGKTGTVHGEDFTFNIPKKVKWDQEYLASLHEEIGDTANEYIDVKYSVSENKYKSWPDVIRNKFIDARTMENGTPTIKVKDD